MVKIDLKDRKILYELDLNSRQTLTKIGKKVGLKKDVVSYRINRMQDLGVIQNFWTLIDAYKLGYIVFRFYLVFQYVNTDIKNKIIEFLVNNKHTWVVESIVGKYDLGVFLWIKEITDFYNFWEKFLDKYGDYFAEKVFSIYVKAYSYNASYLLIDGYKKSDRLNYEVTGGGKKVKIDNMDFQLLNGIAENARIPLVDLAKKLNCSSQMVNYRLKNLMEKGVIQGFRVGIDVSQFGLKSFKVDVHLRENTQRKKIMNYIRNNPYLTFIGVSAGVSDLELEFDIENSEKLSQIMDELSIRFQGALRKYEYFSASNTHKLRCIPEL